MRKDYTNAIKPEKKRKFHYNLRFSIRIFYLKHYPTTTQIYEREKIYDQSGIVLNEAKCRVEIFNKLSSS